MNKREILIRFSGTDYSLLLGQQLVGGGGHLLPRVIDIGGLGESRTNRHTQEVRIVDLRWHQMNLATSVDALEQCLVQLVGSLQSKASQSHLNSAEDLEAFIRNAQGFELLGEGAVATDVGLDVLNSVQPEHEPQLEGTETTTQRDLPVTVVRSGSLHVVLQVERVDVERVDDPVRLLQPHGTAVKVDQHPLVGVEVERIGRFDSLHQRTVLGTDEGRPGVRSVHVDPDVVLVADWTELVETIERTRVGRSQGAHGVERDQPVGQVLLNGGF